MNSTSLAIKRVLAAGLLTAIVAPAAWAQPLTVVDGDFNLTVPVYPGPFSPPPGYTVLGSTGIETGTLVVNDSPVLVAFDEYAVTTPLNPFNTKTADGVTFVFAVAALSNIGPATFDGLPGFTGYQTAVEACDPLSVIGAGSAASCSNAAGTVSRDGGAVSFGAVQLSPGTIDGFSGDISYAYAIFTDASTFTDPSGACLSGPGASTPACFNALAPSGSTVGSSSGGSSSGGSSSGGNTVPEPGVLALLGLGLTGLILRRRKTA